MRILKVAILFIIHIAICYPGSVFADAYSDRHITVSGSAVVAAYIFVTANSLVPIEMKSVVDKEEIILLEFHTPYRVAEGITWYRSRFLFLCNTEKESLLSLDNSGRYPILSVNGLQYGAYVRKLEDNSDIAILRKMTTVMFGIPPQCKPLCDVFAGNDNNTRAIECLFDESYMQRLREVFPDVEYIFSRHTLPYIQRIGDDRIDRSGKVFSLNNTLSIHAENIKSCTEAISAMEHQANTPCASLDARIGAISSDNVLAIDCRETIYALSIWCGGAEEEKLQEISLTNCSSLRYLSLRNCRIDAQLFGRLMTCCDSLSLVNCRIEGEFVCEGTSVKHIFIYDPSYLLSETQIKGIIQNAEDVVYGGNKFPVGNYANLIRLRIDLLGDRYRPAEIDVSNYPKLRYFTVVWTEMRSVEIRIKARPDITIFERSCDVEVIGEAKMYYGPQLMENHNESAPCMTRSIGHIFGSMPH